MNVQTVLNGELEELFKEELQSKKLTKYQLAKKAIEAYLKKEEESEPPKEVGEIITSGDFEEDVKTIDRSGITTAAIKKALQELDQQKKTKNSIKKGGAFHEENCIIDIRSIVEYGKPNFHELKYHMDWWLQVGLLTNVLARRGIRMSKKCKGLMDAFEERNYPEGNKMTSYERSIMRQRVGVNKKNGF